MTNRRQPNRKVTIIDVAREAGVSHATVSRVLNQSAYVDPEKQQRVIQAMTQLGFSANQHARSLASNRSQLVGIVVEDVSTGYSAYYDRPIMAAAQAELAEKQYNLLLYNRKFHKMRESAYIASLTRGLADGYILLLPEHPEAYIQAFQKEHIPYVMIDHQGIEEPVPAVRSANRQGGYEATKYLIELGHRRIGFVTGHITWGCSLERLEGYKAALAEYGIIVDPALIEEGNFTQASGYNAAEKLFALAEPPTAIFTSNDSEAFGVMEAARERHLQIPQDISIVGFDDLTPAASVHPPLTTVRQPLEQIGRMAARMLLDYLRNPDVSPSVLELPTTLVVRQSCQPPRI